MTVKFAPLVKCNGRGDCSTLVEPGKTCRLCHADHQKENQ